MKDYIEERAVEIANYIIETKATVRQTAKKFGISKSTVHMVVTKQNDFNRRVVWNDTPVLGNLVLCKKHNKILIKPYIKYVFTNKYKIKIKNIMKK